MKFRLRRCLLWIGAVLGLSAGMLAVVLPQSAVAATAPVMCHGVPLTQKAGTIHDDVIVGTAQRDVIAGGSGSDAIIGLGGNDLICGGRGGDAIDGGRGLDAVYAGLGWNTCFAPSLFEHRNYHHRCQEHALLPTGSPRHPKAMPAVAVAASQQQRQTPTFDVGQPICTYGEITLGNVAARPIYAGGAVAIMTQIGVQTAAGVAIVTNEPYKVVTLQTGSAELFTPYYEHYDATPDHYFIRYAVWFWDGANWVDGAWYHPGIEGYGYRSPTGGAFLTAVMAFCEAA